MADNNPNSPPRRRQVWPGSDPSSAPSAPSPSLKALKSDAEVFEYIRALEERLDVLENGGRQQPADEDEDRAANMQRRVERQGHRVWFCLGCRGVLAYYDVTADTIRAKTSGRAQAIYVRLGEGGQITITCWRCMHVNTQDYVSKLPGADKPPA